MSSKRYTKHPQFDFEFPRECDFFAKRPIAHYYVDDKLYCTCVFVSNCPDYIPNLVRDTISTSIGKPVLCLLSADDRRQFSHSPGTSSLFLDGYIYAYISRNEECPF